MEGSKSPLTCLVGRYLFPVTILTCLIWTRWTRWQTVSSNRMPSLTSSKSPLVGRYLFRTNAAGHWYDAHWPFKPGSRDAHWKRKPLEASPETSINLTLSQPSHWVSFVWSQLIMTQIPRVNRHLNLGLRIPTSSIIGDIIIFSFHIGFVAIFTRWALS